MEHKFKVKLIGKGPGESWVFLPIPLNAEKTFGSKGQIPVKGLLNGFEFRNRLLPNGDGTHSMAVNKQLQAGAGARAGDTVEVTIGLDHTVRKVTIPRDFQDALKTASAADRFMKLSFSKQKAFAEWIASAKRDETRTKRIQSAIELIAAGKSLDR